MRFDRSKGGFDRFACALSPFGPVLFQRPCVVNQIEQDKIDGVDLGLKVIDTIGKNVGHEFPRGCVAPSTMTEAAGANNPVSGGSL